MYASSTNKSKINTANFTETEVISVGEKLLKHLRFKNFLIKQTGDPSQVRVLYRDNKSAILLQNNNPGVSQIMFFTTHKLYKTFFVSPY